MSTPLQRSERDGVVVLTLDTPDRSVNVVDEGLLEALRDHLDAALAEPGTVGVVLRSAKPSGFGAGADLAWLAELAARDDAAAVLARIHELMLLMCRAPVPLVAAVHGTILGGAFELALGTDAVVASTDAVLGLPEVTLELLPGGGGTQLLRRFVPTAAAVELLTSGRRLDAAGARELGLVQEVVDGEHLLDAAIARVRAGVRRRPPEEAPDDVQAAIETRRGELEAGRRGISHAAASILDVVGVGARDGLEAGLAAERAAFLDLVRSPEARAAIHLFLAEADVRRRSRGDGQRTSRLGVVGGGQMGSGIAATAASRRLPVVVRDVDDEALERARSYLDRVLRRTACDEEPDDRGDAWAATTGWEPLGEVDAVVEAVFEDPDLKRDVLARVAQVTGPDTLVATNTSAIPIASLATAVPGPARMLGMHFFSPVDRMPLVELVPHAGTSAETLARAAALGAQLGKVPVVVGDAPGFCTSRVYARWLVEGVRLVLDGTPPDVVDTAARAVGFPVGPLQAHDEATLDLVLAASISQVADRVMADRIEVAAVRAALEALVGAGIRGRRHGEGFWVYGEDGARQGPNPRVPEVLGVDPGDPGPDVVGERLLLAFATECFLCWDDGTLCHPDDGDVAAVLGIGFPRALGGPFHWADELGAADVVARCERLGATAFPPGTHLRRAVEQGGAFADVARRPAPFAEPVPAR